MYKAHITIPAGKEMPEDILSNTFVYAHVNKTVIIQSDLPLLLIKLSETLRDLERVLEATCIVTIDKDGSILYESQDGSYEDLRGEYINYIKQHGEDIDFALVDYIFETSGDKIPEAFLYTPDLNIGFTSPWVDQDDTDQVMDLDGIAYDHQSNSIEILVSNPAPEIPNKFRLSIESEDLQLKDLITLVQIIDLHKKLKQD